MRALCRCAPKQCCVDVCFLARDRPLILMYIAAELAAILSPRQPFPLSLSFLSYAPCHLRGLHLTPCPIKTTDVCSPQVKDRDRYPACRVLDVLRKLNGQVAQSGSPTFPVFRLGSKLRRLWRQTSLPPNMKVQCSVRLDKG